jgi:hypothetical protein
MSQKQHNINSVERARVDKSMLNIYDPIYNIKAGVLPLRDNNMGNSTR